MGLEPIAIVGMACRYPDAASPRELWENVLAQRRSFRRFPAERLRLEDYYSADRQQPDGIYATQAALIEGYEFDRVRFRVVGSTFRAADLAHWLALDVSAQALQDAGFDDAKGLDAETTGVILGNSLTGEFSRAGLMRYRWPYVRRHVEAALVRAGIEDAPRSELLQELERDYKAPFPPPGDESLAGGLSNTIAGRVCNHFNFQGGGFTVDGACASSLLAVTTACSSLVSGDLDVALAGGVDLSLDPFELVGFSKVGALASDQMRVYDARSDGFLPGEGCGVVVLMRYEDALASGRRIYGLLRGWGVSSDGSGGITRPEEAGQLLALRRAYRRAGFGVHTVGYLEGHGTGTAVGDQVELRALSRARRDDGLIEPAVIGSIKANIGHTKAAAGVAGLIKATMALHNQVLPPTTGCEQPHPELLGPKPALRVLREAEPWPERIPLRAGVSAMGFGGINSHVALEGISVQRRRGLTSPERRLSSTPQDAELFLFAARNHELLRASLQPLRQIARRVSQGELTDLASSLVSTLGDGPARAALVASTPQELAEKLEELDRCLAEDLAHAAGPGFYLGTARDPVRIGFLFPGQGSPSHVQGGLWRRRFGCVQELYELRQLPVQSDTINTTVAQPAIVTASLAGLRVMQELGIEGHAAVGHSLGELTALHWAGVWDEPAILRIATARGRAMSELGAATGKMAGIGTDAARVSRILNGEAVQIAGYNSPRQTVISGEAREIEAVVKRARQLGWSATLLPVSHAFHSELVAAAAPVLGEQLAGEHPAPLRRAVASTVTGQWLAEETDLPALLIRQVTSPVRFIEAVGLAEPVDLWIEVGPGRVLSGMMNDLSRTPVVSLDSGSESIAGLLQAAGWAFVLGASVRAEFLFRGRHLRPFELDWRPRFLCNPCEEAPSTSAAPMKQGDPDRVGDAGPAAEPAVEQSENSGADEKTTEVVHGPDDILQLVRELVAARAELPVSAVGETSKLLGDLHLNSISVGQLVGEACRKLDLPPPVAPLEYAQATVASLAAALEQQRDTGGSGVAAIGEPMGVDRWVRSFSVRWIESELNPPVAAPAPAIWEIIGTGPLAERLRQSPAGPGNGIIVCLTGTLEQDVELLLSSAKKFLAAEQLSSFVAVVGRAGGCASGFVRTLHLETGRTAVVLHLTEENESAAQLVWAETGAARGFSEVRYDPTGRRLVPRLRLVELEEAPDQWPVGREDVILVSGGGKGIAAECALAFAKKTGARLALLGRSSPGQDLELNLERMRAEGVQCSYFAVDVTQPQAVAEAVRTIQSDLGPVTGFIHGAGVNEPRLINALNLEAFQRTLGPKVAGARNVVASLDPSRLRLLVTFGSIIARIGLPGEADYAMANEWLADWTEKFQREHPSCRCLALEWSVWSGVGMGQRLGRIESLMANGITAITPDEGVDLFCRLVGHPPGPAALVVTGRFGSNSTLPMEHVELPLWRFLEEPKVHYPGVELVVDSILSAETDPYVTEHVLGGERLFPAVMGLEAMAQAAMALARSERPPAFEQVQLDRPVVVPRDGKLRARVLALVCTPGIVEVALRTETTGFQVDHFRARCTFLHDDAPMDPPELVPSDSPIDLDPSADLYDDLLFHTGRFRRVLNYRRLRGRECVVQLEADADVAWFGQYSSQHHVLGDTGVRDAAIHAIQACIPHARLLPVGIERIELGDLPCLLRSRRAGMAKPVLLLHARERYRQGDLFHYDLRLVTESGQVLESWSNLRLRRVETIQRNRSWPAQLLANHLERRFEELADGVRIDATLQRSTQRDERSSSIVRAFLGPEAVLRHRPDGKPLLDGERTVSISHSGEWTLAVFGSGPIGCDLEPVAARPVREWKDLLGNDRWSLVQRIAAETNEEIDTSATRVWTALEAVKKAGGAADAPFAVKRPEPDGWVLLSSGELVVGTVAATLKGASTPLGLAVAVTRHRSGE